MPAQETPTFVLFGGTFNPVHEGHLGLIRGLLAREDVRRVFVVPAARNPFKGGAELLPAALRLEMLERALGGVPGASVLDLELRRGQPSYTVETVAALAAKYPRARFKLAMGWDVYESFSEWRRAGAILEQAGLLVVLRGGMRPPAPKDGAAWLCGLPSRWRKRVRMGSNGAGRDEDGRVVLEFINLKLPRISSSRIRGSRTARQVPEGARQVLEAYWKRSG